MARARYAIVYKDAAWHVTLGGRSLSRHQAKADAIAAGVTAA